MKKSYFKQMLAAILLLCGVTVNAHDFEVGGIYYKILSTTDNTVEVTFEGDSFFSYDEYTGAVTIPSTVTNNGTTYNVVSIGATAFSGCTSLTEVTLPASLTSVGDAAFYGCSALAVVNSYAPTAPQLGNSAFGAISAQAVLYSLGGDYSAWAASFADCTFMPKYYYRTDGLPGVLVGDNHVWESPLINVGAGNSGVRITTFAIDATTSNDLFNNFPLVALGELEFYDANGNKINYTAADVTTNSLESSEGSLEGLCDGDYSTFYHSKWRNGTISPTDYVYLDVQLPVGVDAVSVKIVGRDTQRLVPTFIGVTECGHYCARPESTSGICGDNATWSFADGTLTISGTGDIYDNYNVNDYFTAEVSRVVIEEGITGIGASVFEEFNELTEVEFPSTLTTIGNSAFSGCGNLTNIVIPDAVTSIGEYAFDFCTAFTNLVIPDAVTSIGGKAFENCSNLASLVIGKGVESVYNTSFRYCQKLASIVVDAENPYYDSRDNCNAIIRTETNTLIQGCKATTIPASVTTLGRAAFEGVKELTSIEIPEGVTSFDYAVFWNCSALESIKLPSTLVNLNESTFNNCYALKKVVSHATTAPAIGENTFSGISSEAVLYHGGGDYSAWSSYFASSIAIAGSCGDNVTWALRDSTLTISGTGAMNDYNNSASVPWNGFRNEIARVIIEDGVTSICSYAFVNCNQLLSVIVPPSVTNIGHFVCDPGTGFDVHITDLSAWCRIDYAYMSPSLLKNNSKLYLNNELITDLVIPEDITVLKHCAFEGANIKSVTFHDNFTTIGDYAFNICANLETVNIPASVTSIETYAFSGCESLTSITIPESVTSIGNYAFNHCTNLTSVTSLIPAEDLFAIGDNEFYDVDLNACTLYVPYGAAATYAATDGWSDFVNIVELEQIFPICYTRGDGLPGERINGNDIWESPVISSYNSFDGVRLTMFATSGSNNMHGGYPMVAFGELEFYDAEGNQIEYTAANVATNSLESSEGSLAALCDGEYSTFYHSIWSSDDNNNDDYVYIDVTFPSPVYDVKIKVVGRNTYNPFTPTFMSVTPVGVHCARPQLTSGSCGDNATWAFADSTLTISGTGAMADYQNTAELPWNDLKNEVATLVIEEGITSIARDAFGCPNLKNATLPSTITSIGMGAFSGCESLTGIVVPEGVTDLLYETFKNCTSLADVTLPSSLTTIDWGSFNGCSALVEISLPASVSSIGNWAFGNCESLTSITIPAGVTSIGESVFKNCSSLASITSLIPAENLFAVNSNAFQGVDKDACTLYVPYAAKETYAATEGWSEFVNIASTKFGKCGDNATWELADGVLTISGTGDMYDYDYNDMPWYDYKLAITSVVIESGITSVGDYAFYACEGLTSIEIPNSVTSIEDYAFGYCSSLTSIEIPNSVTSIGNSAFVFCEGLTSIVVKEGNTVYDSRNNCNAVIETATNTLVVGCKNTIIPDGITSIGRSAFSYCDGLTSIEIPNSVTSVGDWAFFHCDGLTSIEIPNSVTSIGDRAFNGCSGLTSIVVKEGNTVYDSRNNCNAVIETATNTLVTGCKNTIIPDGITSIGMGAFYNCDGLICIEIPNSVTSIVAEAFVHCDGLTSIEIPNSVTSIEGYAFGYCRSLTSVKSYILAENLFAIDSNVFYDVDKNTCTLYVPAGAKETYAAKTGWSEFTNIVEIPYGKCGENATWELADGVFTISGTGDMYDYGFDAPWSDYKLEITSVVIESGITSVGSCAFYGCENLASVAIPEGVTTIDGAAFVHCYGLTEITLPSSLRTIGDNAFCFCKNLASVVLPDGVTTIENGAFQNCDNLASVTIPSSVTTIGSFVFIRCYNLTSVTSLIPAEYLFAIESGESGVFEEVDKSACTLYVPAGAKATYEATAGWNEFTKIVEIVPDAFELTVSTAGYATLYLSYDVERPKGVKAYYISNVANGVAMLEPVWDYIPAKTGVILQAKPGTYSFEYTTDDVEPVADNMLCGTPTDREIPAAANTDYFALGVANGEVGLYRANIVNGVFFNNANKAYLPLAGAQQSARYTFRFPDGSTTDIESVFGGENEEVIYDLSGRRIDEVEEHGVYIINGKKVVR